MKKKNLLYIMLSLLIITTIACKKDPEVKLHISDSHIKLFPVIKSNEFKEEQINDVMEKIEKSGNTLCTTLYKNEKDIDKKLFSNLEKAEKKKLIENWKSLKNSTLLGCSNWYELTDYGVSDSIDKVVKSNKKSKFNAYSLGFIQPYILFWKMKSKHINFADIDYRIINAHVKILSYLKNNKEINVKELIEKLPLPYASSKVDNYFKDDKKDNKFNSKISYEEICPKSLREDFEKSLKWMAENYKNFESINFILSSLNEIDFEKTSNKNLSTIIFLSNAINPDFTSREEYNSFKENLTKTLSPEKGAYAIYTFPGSKSAGIYKIGNKGKTDVLCSDHFIIKGLTARVFVRCTGYRNITKPDVEIFTYPDIDGGIKTAIEKEKLLCDFK